MVVNINLDLNLYEVRPTLGGAPKWVNCASLVLDPREVPEGPAEPLAALPGMGTASLEATEGSDSDESELEPEVAEPPIVPTCRRSDRSTKGQHPNPAH